MKSRSRALADKSIEAMLSAMELYNKPNFAYREEAFSILAINAWELLLKARLLQLSNNRLGAILKYEKRRRADGELSEKWYRSTGRSGTHLSIGLFAAFDKLRDEFGDKVHVSARENLELLCEVRDNAVHFLNKGFDVSKVVQEVGTACLRNYLKLARDWFGIDLSQYNFFLMPLAFVGGEGGVDVITVNSAERKVLDYMRQRIADDPAKDSEDFCVAMKVDLKFMRSKEAEGVRVVVTNDPNATLVRISEEDIREKYPWDYDILTTRLRKRYTDFKANQSYHDLRKPLEANERFCKMRFLDPAKQAGTGKRFYNPNIVKEFDGHYVRKG